MTIKQFFTGSTPVAFYSRLFIAGVLIVGGAFLVGNADSGEINVAATIQNSEATGNDGSAQSNGSGSQPTPIPEAFRNMPNGGLVPQDGSAPAPAPAQEVTVTETATATASTTNTEATTR